MAVLRFIWRWVLPVWGLACLVVVGWLIATNSSSYIVSAETAARMETVADVQPHTQIFPAPGGRNELRLSDWSEQPGAMAVRGMVSPIELLLAEPGNDGGFLVARVRGQRSDLSMQWESAERLVIGYCDAALFGLVTEPVGGGVQIEPRRTCAAPTED